MNEAWIAEAPRSEFFQFVRVCERLAYEARQHADGPGLQPVGQNGSPAREAVRFRVDPSLNFPANSMSIARLRSSLKVVGDHAEDADEADDAEVSVIDLLVNFFGLIGSSGVMPQNYSAIVLQRLRVHDATLREFLDLFHHRLVSHFYRAWSKQHLAAHVEHAHITGVDDLFTTILFSVAGFGTPALRNRSHNPDDVILRYAGLLSQRPRTAMSLQQMLSDHFQLPVRVRQFLGRWLQMEREDRTKLPNGLNLGGQCHELGHTAILGERLWDVQTMIRLVIGPLDHDQFSKLLPTRPVLEQLAELTRTYLGPDVDFDVQLILLCRDVPECRLGVEETPAQLGWNCWLGAPAHRETVDDAVFSVSAI